MPARALRTFSPISTPPRTRPLALLGRYPPGSTFKWRPSPRPCWPGTLNDDPTACIPTAPPSLWTATPGTTPAVKPSAASPCNAPLGSPAIRRSSTWPAPGPWQPGSSGQASWLRHRPRPTFGPLLLLQLPGGRHGLDVPGVHPPSPPDCVRRCGLGRGHLRNRHLANLTGTPVNGKTGTAERGPGSKPPTDAWFATLHGDIAVAVVVENARFDETVAVPVAASFRHAVTR